MVTVNSNGTTQVPLKSRSRSFRAGTNTATRNTCHMLSPPSQSLPPPTSLPARNAENTRVALRIVGSRAQAGFVIRLKGSRRLYLFLQTASMAPLCGRHVSLFTHASVWAGWRVLALAFSWCGARETALLFVRWPAFGARVCLPAPFSVCPPCVHSLPCRPNIMYA